MRVQSTEEEPFTPSIRSDSSGALSYPRAHELPMNLKFVWILNIWLIICMDNFHSDVQKLSGTDRSTLLFYLSYQLRSSSFLGSSSFLRLSSFLGSFYFLGHPLEPPIFVIQEAAAPKNWIEFHQKSIGTVRCSLATSYDVYEANWNRRTGRQTYVLGGCASKNKE